MRILILTTDAYGGHGGIALYNRDLIEAFAEMAAVSEIVVLPRSQPLPLEEMPAKIRFLSHVAGSKLRYAACALRQSLGRFDLVICGHINLLPLATLSSRLLNAPLVMLVYGIDVWNPVSRRIGRHLKHVDAIWSISVITRDRMNAWARLPEGRFVILPNAIHLDRYGLSDKRQELLDRYGLQGSKVIITLARLAGSERYKGFDEVLQVMPELLVSEPSLKYIIAGDGDDMRRLRCKVSALGLERHVIFTGMVSEADKADLLRLSDAFVMPGRGEGFGYVYLEAMACGIPVLGSRLDGSREALREGQLGELVDPSDPAEVKEGILRTLAKPRGIPAGLEYFAWPAFATRVAEAIRLIDNTT